MKWELLFTTAVRQLEQAIILLKHDSRTTKSNEAAEIQI